MLRNWAFLLLAIYWPLMILATHVPLPPRTEINAHHSDKVVHVGMFLILSVLLAAAARRWFELRGIEPKQVWRWVLLAMVIVGYGALDELTQPLTGRDCDFYDWVADMAGALIAAMAIAALSAVRRRRQFDAAVK